MQALMMDCQKSAPSVWQRGSTRAIHVTQTLNCICQIGKKRESNQEAWEHNISTKMEESHLHRSELSVEVIVFE